MLESRRYSPLEDSGCLTFKKYGRFRSGKSPLIRGWWHLMTFAARCQARQTTVNPWPADLNGLGSLFVERPCLPVSSRIAMVTADSLLKFLPSEDRLVRESGVDGYAQYITVDEQPPIQA